MILTQIQLEKLISKLFSVIKPKGVIDIDFNVEPLEINDDEYYLSITYVVPDDSEFLRSHSTRDSDRYRLLWNKHLVNTIESYFNTKVFVINSSIISKSFYNRMKNI